MLLLVHWFQLHCGDGWFQLAVLESADLSVRTCGKKPQLLSLALPVRVSDKTQSMVDLFEPPKESHINLLTTAEVLMVIGNSWEQRSSREAVVREPFREQVLSKLCSDWPTAFTNSIF